MKRYFKFFSPYCGAYLWDIYIQNQQHQHENKFCLYLKRMVVFVEAAVLDDPLLTENPAFIHIQDKLMTFTEGKDDLTDKIDFIVCLGGDGTLLYASSLFQQSVPPVMAFHMGSLGFLTPFEIENFEQQVTHVLEGRLHTKSYLIQHTRNYNQ